MRALVTGSSGFAGLHLTRSLEDDGWQVTPFDIRRGDDIRNYEHVRAAFDSEPDVIFHLAAVSQPGEALTDPQRTAAVNVTGTLNVLEAARHTRTTAPVLLAGSSEEYGYEGHAPGTVLTETSPCFPTSAYGASKLAGTALGMAYARRYGLHVAAMRPFNHTGWGRQAVNAESAFTARIVAVERGHADSVTHGDLTAVRNFTDVRDVIAAYRLAAAGAPGIYNVCSGHTVSLGHVMDTLIALSGTEVTLKQDPRLGHASAGPFPQPSAAKLRAATGWQPAYDLNTTLAWLLDYWRSR